MPVPSFRGRKQSGAALPAGPIVDCAVYADGVRLPGCSDPAVALAAVRERPDSFLWLGLHDPDESLMAELARTFGLHQLAVEDVLDPGQRPKVERYDDKVLLIMRTVEYVEHVRLTVSEIVNTGQITVICAPQFVITVRLGNPSELRGVRADLEQKPQLLRHGPTAVLHAVADHIVDMYVEVSDDISDEIDDIEERVFSPGAGLAVEPIYQLKREVVEFRRAVAPLTVPLQQLASGPEPELPKEIRRYLRDVSDHQTQVADHIRDYDESLSALINAALAKVGVQQNTDMRKISAWAAIAAVPTAIAGIYGMNFKFMPELDWKYGYFVVLGLMVTACVVLFFNFRRNNWL
ncbi:magnesium/cobalt transporter CorA [Nocardia stercoris]|nr:magnesium/cobalt transporter CorA [Nocardia stercoris]